MDYIIAKSDKSADKADYHLMGIFADKTTNHIDKKVGKSTTNTIICSIKNNEISGEIGDYQIFDDNGIASKVVIFGLGEKKKFSPIILNKAVSSVIKKISKTEQTTDWGSKKLTQAQQKYAATDVLYLHKIKIELDKMLIRENP